MPVNIVFLMFCALAAMVLPACERQRPVTPVLEEVKDTLTAMHAAVGALNDEVAEINRQLSEAREAPSAAGANALRLAGECQASLIATSLVYRAAADQLPSRNVATEASDLELVREWRERHGIGAERFEAAVGVAMLRFLERHRTYGVTESADDDAGRMVELNKLHDACEAMRLFTGDESGTDRQG